MSALDDVEGVIGDLIRREALNARIHRDAAIGHYKRAAELHGAAAVAYDPDQGNDDAEGDRLTKAAEQENAAGDTEMKKAFAEDERIKGKRECLEAIRRKWARKEAIPSVR